MNLIWLPAARRDLEATVQYIAERNVDAAQA
jgi:plasmid stabilization system protein ParE